MKGTQTKIEKDPFFMAQWIPSSLFRSSVLPVRHFTMKGIWWYQGESNASDPARYDEKFKAMVLKFREVFGDDLPVICTVMADFDDPANGKIGDIASGFEGKRFDVGDKFGFIKANIEFALKSKEIGKETAEYIKEIAEKL